MVILDPFNSENDAIQNWYRYGSTATKTSEFDLIVKIVDKFCSERHSDLYGIDASQISECILFLSNVTRNIHSNSESLLHNEIVFQQSLDFIAWQSQRSILDVGDTSTFSCGKTLGIEWPRSGESLESMLSTPDGNVIDGRLQSVDCFILQFSSYMFSLSG